jgi:hypothetical protein
MRGTDGPRAGPSALTHRAEGGNLEEKPHRSGRMADAPACSRAARSRAASRRRRSELGKVAIALTTQSCPLRRASCWLSRRAARAAARAGGADAGQGFRQAGTAGEGRGRGQGGVGEEVRVVEHGAGLHGAVQQLPLRRVLSNWV